MAEKPIINTFSTMAEIMLQTYERYLPTAFDESLSLLEKVNKVIEYLNQIGKINNDVVTQWNSVMEWVMNEGLNGEVENKIETMTTDGTLYHLLNHSILSDLSTELNTKADFSYVDNKVNTMSSQVQGFYNTLTDLITAYPSGNTNNYVVKTDNYIYRWNGTTWASTGFIFNSTSLSANSVDEEKTVFFDRIDPKNKFNMSDPDFKDGFFVSITGGVTANATYSATGYIPVKSGEIVVASRIALNQRTLADMRYVTAYDANKIVMSSSGQDVLATSYVVPVGVAYIRVTIRSSEKNTDYMIERTTDGALTPYEPYFTPYYLIKEKYANSVIDKRTGKFWKDKRFSSYGDSVTTQNKWQPLVQGKLSVILENKGVSGTKVADTTGTDTTAMCRSERIDQINSASDIVVFMGGTNDWANNVVIGSMNSTSNTEFYGALKKVAELLTKRFPDKHIVFMTTPYSKYPNRVGWNDTYGLKNNLGLTTGDYAKAIKEVAFMYGFPCVDVFGNAGWNDYNISTFVTNDGAYLHPNDTGAKRIANLVVSKLKEIESLD